MIVNRRNALKFFLVINFCVLISSCADPVDDESTGSDTDDSDETAVVLSYTIAGALETKVSNHNDAVDYTYDATDVIDVALNEDEIVVSPATGTISGTTYTITDAGTYRIHGTLDNGGIIVDAEDQVIKLIFDGIDISNSTTSPINVVAADKTIIILAEGSVNNLSDASVYVFEGDEDEPNAAIFSKSDLSIGGAGELIVKANYEDGIRSKDGLIIHSGSITISAPDDGVTGKDYVIMHDGVLAITASGDGIKSDNEDATDVGFVLVEAGSITIKSQGDGISGETDVLIADGTLNLITGGGSNYTVSGDNSSKGLKATANVIVEGGSLTISSADDAMHSNANLAVNGGVIQITSGDDGIHADTNVGINGGVISITKSYEGIESANISISDGNIHVVASDDGLNGAGGNDGSGFNGPGGGGFSSSSDYFIYLNGGYVYVDSKGDGIDVNGSLVMTGGTVIVNGPTANDNAALDYDASFKISGGTLLAAGSSGMAQAPGSTSIQRSVIITLSSSKSASTIVHLENEGGTEFFTFKPSKQFQSVVYSSPDLDQGSYNIYVGGSSTGVATDGLYEGGEYSGGTLTSTFTVSAITTTVR
jgi:hypothetical protein